MVISEVVFAANHVTNRNKNKLYSDKAWNLRKSDNSIEFNSMHSVSQSMEINL